MHEPFIVVCPGDANGIGPEICAKALQLCASKARFLIIADAAVMETALCRFAPGVQFVKTEYHSVTATGGAGIFLLDASAWVEAVPELQSRASLLGAAWHEPFVTGSIQAKAGLVAYAAIHAACNLLANIPGTLVTGCIHKEALRAAGVQYIGHTEMIAGLAGVHHPLTMFQTLSLRVFFLTRHVSLREACVLVTRDRLFDCICQAEAALKGLGISSPHLAVAGLNPHCGEHGLFGNEEAEQITPAIEAARQKGIRVSGPIGADSVFHMAKMGEFDAVVSLYHDQGHIAAKTLDFDRTISLTLGLPFLRTSVDHGTAMDIAGKGIAREISMLTALETAISYSA